MIRRRPFLASAAAAASFAASDAARAQAPGKLVIATQPGLGYAPMVVVKQKRWLEEAVPGLEVEWKVISSSVAIREAMLAGEVQIGCGSVAPFLIGRDRGFRTRLIAALNTVDLWLLTNAPRVQSVRDFRPGDKVAVVAPDTNQAFVLRRAAQQAFGDPKALDLAMLSMPHPDALQSVLTNQVAGYVGAPPFQEAAAARGVRRLLSSTDLFGPLTFNVCFAREQLERQNAPALRALQAAVQRAIGLLTEQPAEAATLLALDAGQPEAELARQLAQPETRFTTEPAGVDALGAFMHETGFLRAPAGKLDELLFRL
jgi:NitT/TauT family transport system substrate-binding protein